MNISQFFQEAAGGEDGMEEEFLSLFRPPRRPQPRGGPRTSSDSRPSKDRPD
jgi:hypothetical protein